MARPESTALGGFYPAPPELYRALASTVRVSMKAGEKLFVADPCAGTGDAVVGLAREWIQMAGMLSGPKDSREAQWGQHAKVFACEMEETRGHSLRNALYSGQFSGFSHEIAHGDSFLLANSPNEGVHILWHNCPYDFDRQYRRLEERWLRRFAPLVTVGGAILHFVPFYTLADSADTIARHFEDVACWRVPAPHFEAFKQVVLVGRRRMTLATPEPSIAAQVRAWSADAASIPELPVKGLHRAHLTVKVTETAAPSWKMGEVDLLSILAAYQPWTITDRAGQRQAVANVEPEDPYTEIMAPRLRLACPPRPAHIAMAAGAGILSGARLTPDAGQRGPELLLKGVHRRTFRHLRWKEAKGERVAEERQHHPELQLSILDLSRGRYHRLVSSVEPSGHEDPAQWSVGDLLARYSGSMLDALRARCELLYDPTREEDKDRLLFPVSPDPLLGGQEDGVRALLRLLEEPDRAAVLLGQIGVGKTRMSLLAAYYYLGGVGKVLVLCPTSLLPEWKSEVAKVLPDARVTFLESVNDIDAFAEMRAEGMEIAVLSKEPAKLGHAWEGVARCGACGALQAESREKLAEQRLSCGTTITTPANGPARILARLTVLGGKLDDAQLRDACRRVGGRILRRAWRREDADWRDLAGVVRGIVKPLRRLVEKTTKYDERGTTLRLAYWNVLHALGDDALIVREAMRLFRSTLESRSAGYGGGDDAGVRDVAAKTLLLLPPSSPLIASTLGEMRRYEGHDAWNKPHRLFNGSEILTANKLRRDGKWKAEWKNGDPFPYDLRGFGCDGDEPLLDGRKRGSDDALKFAIERLATVAAWEEETCGELLYQAVPNPRRVSLAKYILKRAPHLFDFMIIDEFHKFQNGDSAQSRAASRLLSLRSRRKIPVIALTGSVMNGYARTLFVLLWHLSSRFRQEFEHGDVGEFERRYGFLVQVVEQVDENKKRVVFGTHSDRVTTRERTTGAAPGVLPTAVMRFLLPISVVVQLADLEIALPPVHERLVSCAPSEPMKKAADLMQRKICEAIGKDRFKAGRAGKLFGALGHLPRYYDHATADLGNTAGGDWTIAYPEDTDMAGESHVLHVEPGMDPKVLLPKEEALVREVRAALERGRNVVVATVRTALGQRLARILKATGVTIAHLDAKKVSAKNRREWVIDAKENGARILVCNPAALPEGLNVLVGHFSTVCIYDDPNNDPTLLRQFRGRFVRIGQTEEVDFLIFVYGGTIQADANDLLQKKRVVAEATDGIDASAAFEVAGVGESAAFETDLGRALYNRLTDG